MTEDPPSMSLFVIVTCLVILLILSAFFSATETAFSAINRVRLKNLAGDGKTKARLAVKLSEDYDKLLSTILIGNNIVNIAAASLATVVFVRYFGDVGVTVSTIVMTILVLIFGEISPKSLAKESPEAFACFAAPIINFFMFICTPLTFIFSLWKKMLSKIFKISADKGITEEELLTWVEEAESEGGIKIEEGELIKSAIEFNDLDVTDIVTPRVDVVAVSKEDDVEDIEKDFSESGFSRLPVFDETIDDIVGIVHQKDFYSYVLRGEKTLREIIKPAIYAPPTMKISKLLKLLQKSKSHMAIITDEYGGTKGIATLEDIIEELVGEIWDEHDEISHEIEIIADNKYKIAGSAHLDKMFDYFDLPEEEDEDLEVNTVSGFVVHKLGKFPNRGDSFVYKDLHITVSKIDSRRVVEIIVIK